MAEPGLAADQKKARRLGASIAFIDETGFRLQPVNRRTWAPCGVTPIQRAWDRHDRLSVISAVTLSPRRQRIGLPFQIFGDNIRTPEVVAFVQQLRRQLRRPLIIIWDRWRVHRAAYDQLQTLELNDLAFEWLPAYAPELNPAEPRWSHIKFSALANYVPYDTGQLHGAVRRSLTKQESNLQLKRSFFKAAKLKL
jgi:transposase